MSINIYGRDDFIAKIKGYAESDSVMNEAFYGVKGVGKTSIFTHYFTKAKIKEIALNYKKLFVLSSLDTRKKGEDLYLFFIDELIAGIRNIPDTDKEQIKDEIKEIEAEIKTPESRLKKYLKAVKDNGYSYIFIMDHFHCMTRDTDVGQEQYNILRELNESNLITYWIIMDTDLNETVAAEGYVLSFFAQKFTSLHTICPLKNEHRIAAVNYFAEQKQHRLIDNEKALVADISGGVPLMMSILIDILNLIKQDRENITEEALMQRFLSEGAGISLFNNWTTGLNYEQKKILFDIASAENGLSKNEVEPLKCAGLADESGRGLLHKIQDDEYDETSWIINTELFKRYILSLGEKFYLEPEKEISNSNTEPSPVPSVTNIYNYNNYISGDLINHQTNNILNIENAVAELEDLQKLVSGDPLLLKEKKEEVVKKLEALPFGQETWKEIDEEKQEEELEKYADGIFNSDIFKKGNLTDDQMKRFCLNEEILNQLSENCKTQIICGIQVYDLIQLCINNFGLNMKASESPRGILFARAFETHLRDLIFPVFKNTPEIANREIKSENKVFKFQNYKKNKTTIGTYSTSLNDTYIINILASASMKLPNHKNKNKDWWEQLKDRLSVIGNMRNACCHGGEKFDDTDLSKLIKNIFKDGSIKDILIFKEMQNLTLNPSPFPGARVKFMICKETNGDFTGTIGGKDEALLPRKYAAKMNFNDVKNTEIDVIVECIKDGKYRLKW